MKTPIIRSVTALLWWWLACYAWFLYSQWAPVWTTAELTTAWIVVAMLVWIYLVAIIIASNKILPTNRYTIALIWIALILFANLYLVDDPTQNVYLADVMKIIWVFLVIIWPMKLLVTTAIQENKASKNVEIIEV